MSTLDMDELLVTTGAAQGGVASDGVTGSGAPRDDSPGHDSAGPRPLGFRQLEDVIADDSFPEVDLALRRGRHIHPGDDLWYPFLVEAQPFLEPFYRRYGCELEQRADGYYFLLPLTDSLGKRHLGVPEMIVGQGLALCFLDPRSVQSGGVVTREELLNQLASVMGTDALMHTLNPKRKRADERVMQRTVRQKVNEALRRLSQLGFVELLDGEQLRLWPSLMRFAEPVRGLDAPSEALKRMLARGEVSLGPGDADEADADGEVEADTDPDAGADGEDEASGVANASGPAPEALAAATTSPADELDAEAGTLADGIFETDIDLQDEAGALAEGFEADVDMAGTDAAVGADAEASPDAVPSRSVAAGTDEAPLADLDIDWDEPPGEKA
jgi:chromosome partition protein MukE